jgi:hypothetical protein
MNAEQNTQVMLEVFRAIGEDDQRKSRAHDVARLAGIAMTASQAPHSTHTAAPSSPLSSPSP